MKVEAMGVTGTMFALGLATPTGAQTVPPAAQAADRIADLLATYKDKTMVVRPCPAGSSADIVVCGGRSERSRQRLPLPEEAFSEGDGQIVRGELPRASGKPIKQGSCGVVQGIRPCSGGLNPLAMAIFVAKVARKLVDPEWDAEPPPQIPDHFRGIAP